MQLRKMLPYAAGAGAALGLILVGKEAADALFSMTHPGMEPSSLGQLYQSLPLWMKIVAPIELSTIPIGGAYAGKKLVESMEENSQ